MHSAESRELLDLLGDHLAEPVDLYLRMGFTIEVTFVRLAVGMGWLKAALQRAVAVADTGMTKGVSDENSAGVDEVCTEVGTLHWTQEVDTEHFRVVGTCSDGGCSASPWLPLRELVHSIVAMRAGRPSELGRVATYGDALFFDGDDDVSHLIAFVRERVPGVVARQTQMDMAAQIRTSAAAEPFGTEPGGGAGAPGAPGATPARRRPGL